MLSSRVWSALCALSSASCRCSFPGLESHPEDYVVNPDRDVLGVSRMILRESEGA